MLICLPWKGSGGGVVYGCGVWRVKSWVKNVPDANKYIAISPIKWGWSSLTYLPLVVIILEKSIILFYWTPYRGIDTQSMWSMEYRSLRKNYWTPYRGIDTFHFSSFPTKRNFYWTPYRGIDTLSIASLITSSLMSIEPLIGGLIPVETILFAQDITIEPLIGGLTYPCGNEQLAMSNE